jgi:hypothetical protein
MFTYFVALVRDCLLDTKGYIFFGFLSKNDRLNNIFAIQQQIVGILSVCKEKLGKGTSVVHSTYFINKVIVCSENNDVDHISDEVLQS